MWTSINEHYLLRTTTGKKRRAVSRGDAFLVVVLLVVRLLSLLSGVVLGLFSVKEVEALSLEELVDLSTGETGEELLGELVAWGFAFGFLVLLIGCRRGIL